jgi:signal transduction histidine kinase
VRTFASIGVLLGALAGILAVSVASALSEQKQFMAGFTATTRQQVHASAEALSGRLDALDQDTRMLVDLVESSRRQSDYDDATERRVWEGAFRAMAVVVAEYRTISLVGPDGALEVMVSAPSVTPETIEALRRPTRRFAAEVSIKRSNALGSPVSHGGRSFLLYGTPLRGGGAIVVASDAAVFLGAVARTPPFDARLFVTDPAGVVWSDCETAGGCHATPSDAISKALAGTIVPPRPAVWQGAHASARTMWSAPTIEVSERLSRPTGGWMVTWVASTADLVARERSLLERVILTTLAAAMAVGLAGAFILRQQKKAVTLESRLEVAQALASARETSQSLVENAPLGVLGVSPDLRVVLANGFLTERLGPIRLGEPLREAFYEPDRAGAGAVAFLDEIEPLLLAAARGDAGATEPQELRAMGSDAHQLYVRIVPVRNHALGVRVFAIVEDQSALRNLENQLVRAEKLITVGVLSAGIAHEIGSPLAVIRGRAEQVLKHLPELPAEGGARPEDVRVIIKHIDHITSTIRQLLDFSRRQAVAPSAVPLAVAVERARGLVQWKLGAKELDLKVTIDADLPPLAADPDQLQQVLVNLLLNACDASERGRPVLVAARAAGKDVTFEVADQGHGIAAEHMNAVFDPFFTTKKRGEGTGLGLTIAAGIVRNHGGQINLTSTAGKGTTVTVRWPVARERRVAAFA